MYTQNMHRVFHLHKIISFTYFSLVNAWPANVFTKHESKQISYVSKGIWRKKNVKTRSKPQCPRTDLN